MTATSVDVTSDPTTEVEPDFPNRVLYVPSATHPGISHTLSLSESPSGLLRVNCTCPAGRYSRPDLKPIPCRHARAVALYLESFGLVELRTAGWTLTASDPLAEIATAEPSPEPVADPWEAGYNAGWTDAMKLIAAESTALVACAL